MLTSFAQAFALEFEAVIGGLVALIWVLRPMWLPLIFFPAVIAQLTLSYISASGRKTT